MTKYEERLCSKHSGDDPGWNLETCPVCFWKEQANLYLNERQSIRNMFPECLDEFGPTLVDAIANYLRAQRST